MGKKKSRVDLLQELMSLVGKNEIENELPNGKISFCLKCKTRTSALHKASALCMECHVKVNPEELQRYERLVKINQFDSYPTQDFKIGLNEWGLSPEIVEAYFKSFGLQSNATGTGVLLTPTQRAKNLNILFSENATQFNQVLSNLLSARSNSEYDDVVAKAESFKFLEDRFGLSASKLKAAEQTLKRFDVPIPTKYQASKKLLRTSIWDKKTEAGSQQAKPILELVSNSESYIRVDDELQAKFGFSYADVKAGQGIIDKFQIGALKELSAKNKGLEKVSRLMLEGEVEKQHKYISLLQALAQIPTNFELLSNKHGLTIEQTLLAQETAKEIISSVARKEELWLDPINNFHKTLARHSEFLGTTPEAAVRRFIAIVRTYIDQKKKHTCATWIYYLLVKPNPELWLQIMDGYEDPEFWTFKGHCFKIPEIKHAPSSIPGWGYGAPPQSSMGAGRNSHRHYH